MSDEDQSWYLRNRGKVLGPFAWSDLESMRKRGQIARFHEVSQDRRTWISAADVPDLFPRGETTKAHSPTDISPSLADAPIYEAQAIPVVLPSSPIDTGPSWFYAEGDSYRGPVSYQDLQRMAVQGAVSPGTLVWRSGMADWVACRDFPDFVFGVPEHTGPVAAQGPGLHPSAGPAGYVAFAPRTSGLAVASLVLGILYLCGIGSLLATIFGAVALGQISRSRGALTGKGMAVAGLVLGIIGLGFIAVLILTSAMDGTAERIRMRF